MDKQQVFLANNIFDIDSALDRLEENLFTSNDGKSAINTEPVSQQQNVNIEKQQQNKDFEENGNTTLSDGSVSEAINESISNCVDDFKVSSELTRFAISGVSGVDDSLATTADDDVITSEILDNGVTQTITSFSANDKSLDSMTSDSSDSEGSFNSSENIQHNEISSQVTTHIDNDDSSKRLLISDDSSHQQDDISNQQEDLVDDLPVTTDLTLTKTVELTENEPDPVEQPKLPEPEEEQATFNVVRAEIPEPIEMVRHAVEVNDIKEMSHNNFESTMDDISDAELESLEHELEDLVAITELVVEKSQNDIAVKALEDSIEVTAIKEEESTAVIETIEPETGEPEETLKLTTNTSTAVTIDEHSEIQEISMHSENISEQRESSVSEAQEAFEPSNVVESPPATAEQDAVLSTSSTDESTSIQNLPSQSNEDFSINESNSTGSLTSAPDLGRVPPYWIPDNATNQCMHCDANFSLVKRRHHCRACGLLLCSACSSEKFHLHYLGTEGRICKVCLETLVKAQQQSNQPRNPNPANPMEYCSTLPPQQQVSPGAVPPPMVMVPSGVLKRGPRSSERKSVIFSDGIRPGTDLDEPTGSTGSSQAHMPVKPPKLNMPQLNEKTNSFITEGLHNLPPVLINENEYKFVDNNLALLQRLRQEELKFAINKNFYLTVKVVTREFRSLNFTFKLIFYLFQSFLLYEQNGHQFCDFGASGCSTRRATHPSRVER